MKSVGARENSGPRRLTHAGGFYRNRELITEEAADICNHDLVGLASNPLQGDLVAGEEGAPRSHEFRYRFP
jgi:hypothetical protein